MKIRTGFVSNSSSSSFIIIGNPINDGSSYVEDPEVLLDSSRKLLAVFPYLGNSGDNENVLLALNCEESRKLVYDILTEEKNINDIIPLVYDYFYVAYNPVFNTNKLPNTFEFIHVKADDFGLFVDEIGSYESFIEEYGKYIE